MLEPGAVAVHFKIALQCPLKLLTVRTASVCGEFRKSVLCSESNVSTQSKDISGQCNKQASKWIPGAIYHEWEMQAEHSAVLLRGEAAPWQLVYQCQGDSLIYWYLEMAASGGNEDHGYSLRHQPMRGICCVLRGIVLVALCQSKSPAWYVQCWTYLSWEQLWRSAQMVHYIRTSNVPISIWAGSVDGYQHFLCGPGIGILVLPIKKNKKKSWLQPASWQVQNPAPVC